MSRSVDFAWMMYRIKVDLPEPGEPLIQNILEAGVRVSS